ncbi:MAG: hypothetical protein ACR2MX_02750 [Cyclobacteriaceae bacterium]
MKADQKKLGQIEALLQQKTFEELTPQERALVEEVIGSEWRYTKLQQIEGRLEYWYTKLPVNLEPAPHILPSLKRKMEPHNIQEPVTWITKLRSIAYYRIPVPAVFAALLLAGVLFWWLTDKEPQMVERTNIVQLPPKTDTLYITSVPDTIYVEKVVYREPIPEVDINTFNTFTLVEAIEQIELLAVEGTSLRSDTLLQALLVTDD